MSQSITIIGRKPYHAVLRDGVAVGIGGESVTFTPGIDEVFFFDTKQEREQHSAVKAARNEHNYAREYIKTVESTKSLQAYAAMRQDAMDWIRLPEPRQWKPEHYPALAITVEVYGIDPTDAATAMIEAVERDVLAPERERTLARKGLQVVSEPPEEATVTQPTIERIKINN